MDVRQLAPLGFGQPHTELEFRVTRPLVGVPAQRYIVALARPDRAQGLGVRRAVDTLVEIGAQLAG